MRFPWQRRFEDARADTQKAQTEYEWAVQNRTSVFTVVNRLRHHGTENQLVEKLGFVARGGHR